MFKKFDATTDVALNVQLKSSAQKEIRRHVVELYPQLEAYIETIMPKKEGLIKTVKCKVGGDGPISDICRITPSWL